MQTRLDAPCPAVATELPVRRAPTLFDLLRENAVKLVAEYHEACDGILDASTHEALMQQRDRAIALRGACSVLQQLMECSIIAQDAD